MVRRQGWLVCKWSHLWSYLTNYSRSLHCIHLICSGSSVSPWSVVYVIRTRAHILSAPRLYSCSKQCSFSLLEYASSECFARTCNQIMFSWFIPNINVNVLLMFLCNRFIRISLKVAGLTQTAMRRLSCSHSHLWCQTVICRLTRHADSCLLCAIW